MKSVPVLLLTIALLSCSETETLTGPKIGEEFQLQYGKSVQIRGKNLTVQFQKVTEDSRCPTGAVCVWEGNARVALRIDRHDTTVNTTLDPKEIRIGGENNITFTVRLLSVSPYPKMGESIKEEDYIVTLIVLSDEVF